MKIKLPYTEDIIWEIDKNDKLKRKTLISYKDKFIQSNNIHNVICYGGILENYISLHLLSFLKKNNKKTNFIGHYDFILFNKRVTSCLTNSYLLNKSVVENYPAPIFYDKDHNIYYNMLYNLYNQKNYAGLDIGDHNQSILKVILSNIPYENIFEVPIDISRLAFSKQYLNWKNNNKNLFKIPYIIVIPGETKMSIHSGKYLNWNINQCLEFSNLMKKLGIFVIIMSNKKFDTKKEYNHISFGFSQYLDLFGEAFMVLADEIDLLLIKMIKDYDGLHAADIFRMRHKFYSLLNNATFMRQKFDVNYAKNNLLIRKKLSPIDIYNWLKEKL